MNYFRDCTALITGASSGIGVDIARELAPYARRLILVARREDRLEAIKGEIESKHPGVEVRPYAMDVADPAARVKLGEWLREERITVEFLVNNAGLGDHGSFDSAEWGKIDLMLQVNVVALTALTQMVIPAMRKRGRGAILNVSSIASLFPVPNLAVYGATKAYVTSFSEAIRAELRDSGISVTALCPGPVPTEFHQVADRDGSKRPPVPDFFSVDPRQVAREALQAVASDRARIIPGLLVALVAVSLAAVPIFFMRPFLNVMGSRSDES